jgi:transcriptional regulator with XRE-family HTH domain
MTARALVAWNVRRIRVDRGIPQEQLAYDAGIDRSYMSGLERQAENPTIDLLDRLAETLGVQLSEFFVQPPKGATMPRTLPKGRKPLQPNRKKKQ